METTRARRLGRAIAAAILLAGIAALHAHSRIAPPSPKEKEALASLDANSTAQALLQGVSSNSYHVGLKAAQLLAERQDRDTVPALLAILESREGPQNRFAAYSALVALCKLQDLRAANAVKTRAAGVVDRFLVELIPSEQDREILNEIRTAYCKMLTHGLEPPRQAEVLAEQLGFLPDWVRDALVALGETAVPAVVASVTSDQNPVATRVQAVRCLGAARSERALPVLQGIVMANRDDSIRAGSDQLVGEAAAAMVAIAGQKGMAATKDAFRKRKNWATRLYIVRALGELNDPGAGAWLSLVSGDPELTRDTTAATRIDRRVRAVRDHATLSAAKVQVNLAEDRVAALLGLLRHEHPWVRGFAAQSLVGTRDARVLEPAIRALADKDAKVRNYVIEALGLLGDARAVEPLKKVLRGPNMGDHLFAKRALENLGKTVVFVREKHHVLDPDARLMDLLRSSAKRSEALKEILAKGNEGGLLIAAAVQSSDADLRAAGDAAVNEVAGWVSDADPSRAAAAIRVLGGAGPSTVPGLLVIVRNLKSADLRKQIAETIAASGGMAVPSVAAALSMAEDHRAAWVADLFYALSISGRRGAFVLKQHAEGGDPVYRALAKQALAKLNPGKDRAPR